MIDERMLDLSARVSEVLAATSVDEALFKAELLGLHRSPSVMVFASQVIAVPFLTEEACDTLLTLTNEMPREPNLDEEAPYRINELVLHPDWPVYEHLAQKAKDHIWPLFELLYGNQPNQLESIQFARYGGEGPTGTDWHVDQDSEATCVVALTDPALIEGSGTEVLSSGAFWKPVVVPPLPKGWALLFNGRTALHRGLEVPAGATRDLLVYWMSRK